jgi:hypothetical protein
LAVVAVGNNGDKPQAEGFRRHSASTNQSLRKPLEPYSRATRH